jgi:2,3-bisphosphoglycerate-dependent phosphoglycerate mutase
MVLVVAHGNSIRALIKYIESISDSDIADVEMIFGTALIYDVDAAGLMIAKDVLTINSPAPLA